MYFKSILHPLFAYVNSTAQVEIFAEGIENNSYRIQDAFGKSLSGLDRYNEIQHTITDNLTFTAIPAAAYSGITRSSEPVIDYDRIASAFLDAMRGAKFELSFGSGTSFETAVVKSINNYTYRYNGHRLIR